MKYLTVRERRLLHELADGAPRHEDVIKIISTLREKFYFEPKHSAAREKYRRKLLALAGVYQILDMNLLYENLHKSSYLPLPKPHHVQLPNLTRQGVAPGEFCGHEKVRTLLDIPQAPGSTHYSSKVLAVDTEGSPVIHEIVIDKTLKNDGIIRASATVEPITRTVFLKSSLHEGGDRDIISMLFDLVMETEYLEIFWSARTPLVKNEVKQSMLLKGLHFAVDIFFHLVPRINQSSEDRSPDARFKEYLKYIAYELVWKTATTLDLSLTLKQFIEAKGFEYKAIEPYFSVN